MTKFRLFCYLFVVAIIFAFFSCNSQRKTAKDFFYTKEKVSLYITFSSAWELFFTKPQGNTTNEVLARRFFPYRAAELRNDGIIATDSVFRYNLYSDLKTKGYRTYADSSINDFFDSDGEKYIIEILQMYAEEKTISIRDTFFVSNGRFMKFDTLISCFELSFWLKVNPINNSELASPILYAVFPLADYFDGGWLYDFDGNYYYQYSFTPFSKYDIIGLFASSGRSLSEYIYDYFLNMYLFKNSKFTPKFYYTRIGNKLKKTGYKRFVFMENE